MAARNSLAPQVIAYWLTSASIAAFAASLSSGGQAKSGKPCERLMPLCCRHSRVISRMTDSVKVSALALMRASIAAGVRAGAACGRGAGASLTRPILPPTPRGRTAGAACGYLGSASAGARAPALLLGGPVLCGDPPRDAAVGVDLHSVAQHPRGRRRCGPASPPEQDRDGEDRDDDDPDDDPEQPTTARRARPGRTGWIGQLP